MRSAFAAAAILAASFVAAHADSVPVTADKWTLVGVAPIAMQVTNGSPSFSGTTTPVCFAISGLPNGPLASRDASTCDFVLPPGAAPFVPPVNQMIWARTVSGTASVGASYQTK